MPNKLLESFDDVHSEYRAYNPFRHIMWWQRKLFLQLKCVFIQYYIQHRVKIPFVNNTAWILFVYDQRAKRFYHNGDIWRVKCQLMGARAGRATARGTDIQSLYMLRFMYLGYCAYIVCPSWKKIPESHIAWGTYFMLPVVIYPLGIVYDESYLCQIKVVAFAVYSLFIFLYQIYILCMLHTCT